MTIWNGLDGLINDKPFMPGADPKEQAKALMELAEQDCERLGESERSIILEYAEAVQDYRKVSDLINELCEMSYEVSNGYMDPFMTKYIEWEIAQAIINRQAFTATPRENDEGGRQGIRHGFTGQGEIP